MSHRPGGVAAREKEVKEKQLRELRRRWDQRPQNRGSTLKMKRYPSFNIERKKVKSDSDRILRWKGDGKLGIIYIRFLHFSHFFI